MATRSTIVVEIPQDKVGKSYQFDKGNNQFDTPSITIPEGKKYVEVYHHWDGYPTGLGATLMQSYGNDTEDVFDKIMKEVISGGDMSRIGTPYHAWRDEDWNKVQPSFTEEIPYCRENYQYLLTEYGIWKVRDDCKHTDFQYLEDVLYEGFE